jgi:hypothetical protein
MLQLQHIGKVCPCAAATAAAAAAIPGAEICAAPAPQQHVAASMQCGIDAMSDVQAPATVPASAVRATAAACNTGLAGVAIGNAGGEQQCWGPSFRVPSVRCLLACLQELARLTALCLHGASAIVLHGGWPLAALQQNTHVLLRAIGGCSNFWHCKCLGSPCGSPGDEPCQLPHTAGWLLANFGFLLYSLCGAVCAMCGSVLYHVLSTWLHPGAAQESHRSSAGGLVWAKRTRCVSN